MQTMKTLTVRNVPEALAEALEREKGRRGESLNQTVLDLLSQGLGVEGRRSNGLARLAGRWSEAEFAEFQQAVAEFEQIDDELWQ